ncbi:MAG: hypothetical protein IKE20_07755 [Eggerthellaceae bacterium]|nr:hypothetical protein [Eggerthellaceae bacterium]
MSDLFKQGLSFGDAIASNSSEKTGNTPSSSTIGESKVRAALDSLVELRDSGEFSRLGVSVENITRQFSEDPNALSMLAKWTLDCKDVISDDNMYQAATACIQALASAVKQSGNSALISQLKTSLRAMKRNLEQQRLNSHARKNSLSDELSANQAKEEALRDDITAAENAIGEANKSKESASERLHKVPKAKSFSLSGSASTGATIGGIGLAIFYIATFNWDMYAAIIYFIFGIPFAGVMGAIPGAIIGAIVGAVSSGVSSSNQATAESSAKQAVESAENEVAEANRAKSNLLERQRAFEARDSEIRSEIMLEESNIASIQDSIDRVENLMLLV